MEENNSNIKWEWFSKNKLKIYWIKKICKAENINDLYLIFCNLVLFLLI